ncbi:MAG: hypothetical protein HY677_03510 [Chloroflexi bacterium]|nr:hypothetical protein [Chloroflexota bacterium]
MAVALAYLARPVVQTLAPEIALAYPWASLVRLVLVTLAIVALASLLPAYYIGRVEPAAVFKE